MKIVIADNQDITALGLESLCRTIALSEVVRVTDKKQLLDELLKTPDSVVVIDYTLFDFADVDSLLVVSQRFPKTLWLLFSDQLNDQFIRRTVFADSQFGTVLKSSSVIEIRHAVESMAQGQRFICQQVTEMLLSPQPSSSAINMSAGIDLLTPTEREVLKSLALGRTTKEIAAERFSSANTIVTHRKNIFRKLNVNNVHEATKLAFRAGIVDAAEYFI